jgi:TPR repeat protein
MRDVRVSDVAGGFACAWLVLTLAGCAGPPFGPPKPVYDEQGCVENALRREPDPAAVAAARVTFGEKCDAGHADACSALGVMNELGVGGAIDPERAIALYARACDFGNVHGCTNLAVARLEGSGGPRAARFAARILEPACDLGEARACLYLARLHEAGDGTSRDDALAARLFEVACDGEEAPACVARAERLARAGRPAGASAFYGKACSLGDARACAFGTGDASAAPTER